MHAFQTYRTHQTLDTFTIDAQLMSVMQKEHHFAAAIEWVEGVLIINQGAQHQITLVNWSWFLMSIDGGARHTCQTTLLGNCNVVILSNPRLTNHGRLMPDFF